VTPIRLEHNISKTANHYLVCCEAVRLAVLVTAWLLVLVVVMLGFVSNSSLNYCGMVHAVV